MKKNIFMISAAMLALVSCTKDEVIQINHGQKIEFRTALTTRATELTQNDLTEFYVTALTDKNEPYFADITFRKANGATYFTSTEDYYWPAGGSLNFFAYYPSQNELGEASSITITSAKKTLEGYTPSTDVSAQKDFITATATGNKAQHSSSGIALEFKHQLSQIEVNGYNENEGYKISVKAIRIKNVIKTGNFDFGLNNWNLVEATTENLTDYEINFTDEDGAAAPILLTDASQSLMGRMDDNAMLIPQSRPAWGVVEDSTPAQTAEEDEGGETTPDGDGNGEVTPDGDGDGEATPDDDVEEETPTTPETDPNGTYIAFLIQVNTATGIRVFPEITTDEEGKEVDVEYAWVAHPIAFNWVNGYKYVYNCDFSDGLGVIAPDNFEDPENPILSGGGEDPKPGEEIYGGKISVKVGINSWSTNYTSDEGYDSSQDVPMTQPETTQEPEDEGTENEESEDQDPADQTPESQE